MRVFVLGGVSCPDNDPRFEEEKQQLSNACRRIGAELANRGHDILVCSPFEDSADVEVLFGVAKSGVGPTTCVEFHFVDAPLVREKLEGLVRNLGLTNVSSEAVNLAHYAIPTTLQVLLPAWCTSDPILSCPQRVGEYHSRAWLLLRPEVKG
jgi:hypothetical protein